MMERYTIHCSLILLAVGFVGLASARANTPADQQDKQIELLSSPFGIASGQAVCISVVVYSSRQVSANERISAHIQLLDTEGELIAQSGEISIEPGKMGSWNVPREL